MYSRIGVPSSSWKFILGRNLEYVTPEKCKLKYCTLAWHPSPHVSLHTNGFLKVCQYIDLYDSGLIQSRLYTTNRCFAFSSLILVYVCPVPHFLSPSWPIPRFPPDYLGRESCWGTCLNNVSSVVPSVQYVTMETLFIPSTHEMCAGSAPVMWFSELTGDLIHIISKYILEQFIGAPTQ